jgi:hypothetical protein
MPSGIYTIHKADLMNGNVDLVNDTIYVALLDDAHPDAAGDLLADDTWADVSVNEISGTGYTAGGAAMSGTRSVTEAATTYWDTDADQSWTSATFSTWNAVIYDQTVGPNNLICTIDFGGEQQVTGGTFTIQWHVNGITSIA